MAEAVGCTLQLTVIGAKSVNSRFSTATDKTWVLISSTVAFKVKQVTWPFPSQALTQGHEPMAEVDLDLVGMRV